MAGGTFPTSLPAYTITSGSQHLGDASGGIGVSSLFNAMEVDITALSTKMGTGAATPAANQLLVGNGAGTSTWQALTSAQLAAIVSDETGTGVLVLATSPTLTTPKITTSINDTSGNEIIKTPATASATNEITVTNAPNGTAPKISATGSSDANVNLNLIGKGTGSLQNNGTDLLQYVNYFVSGCFWTADAAGSTKAASMTSGVVFINGNFLTVAAVTSRTFTASKDTYVDFTDNGDGTAVPTYIEVSNNAASSALTANGVRNAIIVTGAGNIANAGSINQGDPTCILPIASSIAYSVTDSLGNIICNRSPNPTLIGYRQITTDFTSATTPTDTDITGLAMTVIVPAGRRIKLTLWAQRTLTSAAAVNVGTKIFEGATQLSEADTSVGANINNQVICVAYTSPTAGSHTYKGSINQGGAGTMRFGAGATFPAFISVELA